MSWDMYPDSAIEYLIKEGQVETCTVCSKEIKTMVMRGTGVCGENCRKIRDGEVNETRAQTDAGITNILNQPTGEVNPRGITAAGSVGSA